MLNDSISITNKFNKYFIDVSNDIEKNILKTNYVKENWENLNLNCHINNSIFLIPITRDEIEKYILKAGK